MTRKGASLLGILIVAVLAVGCAAAVAPAEPSPVAVAISMPPATLPGATATVQPSVIPSRTSTPEPTRTPQPSPTPSPTPEPAERSVCAGERPLVAVIVEPALRAGVRSGLNQFEADLCADGYAVVERVCDFAAPPALRAYLADLYGRSQRRLAGAIFVGNVPHAYQWVTLHSANPSIPSSSAEALSFQYYADLNGTFAASAGYTSPGKHPYSFDVHQGDVNWEIWIGVLPPYKGDAAKTVEALNRYFAKNHTYRSGGYSLPRAFLQISEHLRATTAQEHQQLLEGMRTGQYAWTPFSSAANARLYFTSPPGGLTIDQGYRDLSAGVADLTVLDAHGAPQASGKLTIAWAESQPVRTAFFWDTACAAGNLDQAGNVLSSLLYSPTSMVVVAEGTTADSGGFGSNTNGFYGHNIASSLAAGAGLGEAVLGHVNVALLPGWTANREMHFGLQVILGDPTLRLRPTGARAGP